MYVINEVEVSNKKAARSLMFSWKNVSVDPDSQAFLDHGGERYEPVQEEEAVLTLAERQAAAREKLAILFKATDQLLAELENHAKEDAIILGVPFDPATVDYSTWLEAKAAIRNLAENKIPTE